MATNWIKMGVDLRTHPKVVKIAASLKSDRLRVLGALFCAWCVFDAHAEEGWLLGYTPEALDEELGWRGFSRAMAVVGWLEIEAEGLHAPGFEEHNGTTAKRRAVENRRKEMSRKAHDPRTKAERMSAWEADRKRTESGQMSASNADKKRAREEKRREETPETTPASGVRTTPDPGPPAAGVVSPDPKIAAQVDALRVSLPAGTDDHDHAGELWAVLTANGCRGTASHPSVIEMVRAGVTVAELRAAIAEARKSNDGVLNPAYLVPIVERLRSGKGKAKGKAAAWATDERATEAKARELGLWPARGGESWDDLRGRIRAKLAASAQESVR